MLLDVLGEGRRLAARGGRAVSIEGAEQHKLTAALQSQFELLSLEHGLAEAMDEDLLRKYVHDFACMHLMNSEDFTKQAQVQILWRILQLFLPETPLQKLSDIHARFWVCENRLQLYCQILDAVPTAVEPVLQRLLSTSAEEFLDETGISESAAAIDIVVIQLVLVALSLVFASSDYF